MPIQPTHLPNGQTPEEALQAFRRAYPYEEAQEALWQCLQPRLLETAAQSPGEARDRRLALLEHLELLLTAVYRLPIPSGEPGAAASPPQPG